MEKSWFSHTEPEGGLSPLIAFSFSVSNPSWNQLCADSLKRLVVIYILVGKMTECVHKCARMQPIFKLVIFHHMSRTVCWRTKLSHLTQTLLILSVVLWIYLTVSLLIHQNTFTSIHSCSFVLLWLVMLDNSQRYNPALCNWMSCTDE